MKNFMNVPMNGAITTILSTLLSIYILFIAVAISNPAIARDRFQAPEFNGAVNDFNERGDSNDLNVDYIVALTFNKGRKIARNAEEFANNATALFTNLANSIDENAGNTNISNIDNDATVQFNNNTTALFTNLANSVDQINNSIRFTDNGAISNSVVVPLGTQADTIIIINQTQGDSVAIQR